MLFRSVYDQPLTMVFRNTGHLTAAQMRAVFDIGATTGATP